jgi:hypothetical protein
MIENAKLSIYYIFLGLSMKSNNLNKDVDTALNFKNLLYHPTKNKVTIVMVISIDQAYQVGQHLKDFCNAINAVSNIVASVTFIVTGNLKRHYELLKSCGDRDKAIRSAEQLGANWEESQQKIINDLLVPYSIKHWHDVTGYVNDSFTDEDFFNGFMSVSKNYNDPEKNEPRDLVFRKLVDEISSKHALKIFNQLKPDFKVSFDDCLLAAKNYLLEESAIIFKLVNMGFDYQMYPGRGNPAVSYVYKKYFGEVDPLPWKRYRFKGEKHTLPSKTGVIHDRIKNDSDNRADKTQLPHGTYSISNNAHRLFNQNVSQFEDSNYELRQMFDFIIRNTTLNDKQKKLLIQKFLRSIVEVQHIEDQDDEQRKEESPTRFVY